MATRPTTLTFTNSYGPADCARALERFPAATLDELEAFKGEIATRYEEAQAKANAASPKARNVLVRSANAWMNAMNEVSDRIDALLPAAKAKEDDAPAADALDAADAATPAKERGPREGSMMALAFAYLRRCRGNAHSPKEIFTAITEAGWASPAGKTPEATLRAALQNAVKKGQLQKAEKGQYAIA